MSGSEAPHVSETTSLLHDDPSARTRHHEQSSRPSYWYSVGALFVSGIASGPGAVLGIPFLQELFCERGIPEGLIPIHNSTRTLAAEYWLLQKTIGDVPDDNGGNCDSPEYSAAIARFISVSATLIAILMTLTVRYWSGLSDRIGRKRTMQLCSFGSFIALLVYMMVRINNEASLYYLWVGDIIEGMTGSLIGYETIAHAFAADVTAPGERTVVFGRLAAGSATGSTLGVVLGGLIGKRFGLKFVFVWVAPCLAFLNFVYISLVPESLSEAELSNNRLQHSQAILAQHQESHESGFKHSLTRVLKSAESNVRAIAKGVVPDMQPNRLPGKYSILSIAVIIFVANTASIALASQMVTYLVYMFHFDETNLAVLLIISGLSRFVYLTVLLPFIKQFAPKDAENDTAVSINFDLKLTCFAVLSELIFFLVFANATSIEIIYVSALISSLTNMFTPAIRSIVSQSVAPEQIGVTFGTLSTVASFAAIITPLPAGWIYSLTVEFWPTALFYVGMVFTTSALALCLYMYFRQTQMINYRTAST
ncbi:hypothetical protein BGZ80_002435 [Entomortierella chlamydospora]|uniref:Major facilitator superfamily (MFS) profile domain-containing protein n=1 Tax=Entomortierella chlamydospora TaxID=101097 RepID=A0A9P6N2A6_9FUNG|nr:hypothetical protein BGZ79_010083 [Entomortierella chlamydospora]KAG0021417.1 hypothetical protein BGZ80_002435 [Entomortierella chlamydospora]